MGYMCPCPVKALQKTEVHGTRFWFIHKIAKNCEGRLLASPRQSVCPSDWNNSAPTGRIFMKFSTWVLFGKSVEKIQVLFLKNVKNSGHCIRRPMYISLWILPRMTDVSDIREEIKTYIWRSVTYIYIYNLAGYLIMWKIMAQPDSRRRWQNVECTFQARYLRLTAHTQNM